MPAAAMYHLPPECLASHEVYRVDDRTEANRERQRLGVRRVARRLHVVLMHEVNVLLGSSPKLGLGERAGGECRVRHSPPADQTGATS